MMDVVLWTGQSQTEQISIAPNVVQEVLIPGAGYMWSAGSFTTPTNTLVNTCNRFYLRTGRPLYIYNASVGGSELLTASGSQGGSWSDPSPGSPLANALTGIAAIRALGGNFRVNVLTIGETDSSLGASQANIAASILVLQQTLSAAAGVTNMPTIVTQLGSVVTDPQWMPTYPAGPAVLAGQREATRNPNIFIGPDYFDLTYLVNPNSIHLDENGRKNLSDRIVDRMIDVIGLANQSTVAPPPPPAGGEHFWGSKGNSIVPANGGRDISCTLGNWSSAKGDTAIPASAFVGWGIKLVANINTLVLIGAIDSNAPTIDNHYIGGDPNGCGLRSGTPANTFIDGITSGLLNVFSFAPGDVFYFDIDDGVLSIRQNNGPRVAWCTGLSGLWYPAASLDGGGNVVRLISDAASLAGNLPAGCEAYGGL
jgi:hypothetical protein